MPPGIGYGRNRRLGNQFAQPFNRPPVGGQGQPPIGLGSFGNRFGAQPSPFSSFGGGALGRQSVFAGIGGGGRNEQTNFAAGDSDRRYSVTAPPPEPRHTVAAEAPYVGSTGTIQGSRARPGRDEIFANLKGKYTVEQGGIKGLLAAAEYRFANNRGMRDKYSTFEESGYGDPFAWWADIIWDMTKDKGPIPSGGLRPGGLASPLGGIDRPPPIIGRPGPQGNVTTQRRFA